MLFLLALHIILLDTFVFLLQIYATSYSFSAYLQSSSQCLCPPNAFCFLTHYWMCVARSLKPMIPYFLNVIFIHCFTEMSCVYSLGFSRMPTLHTITVFKVIILLNVIDGYQYLSGTCCLHLEDPDYDMHHHHLSSLRYSVLYV